MPPTIAIIAPGAMGSAIAARLTRHGVTVLTSLQGRSPASIARAKAAGMHDASDAQIAAEASLLLSIVPPKDAIALAERFTAPLANSAHPAIFVDCNAISVTRVTQIGAILRDTRFIDGGIIGGPPKADDAGPVLHLSGDFSGPVKRSLQNLQDCGLRLNFLDGPIGAASALKLSYAGITKGLVALGTAMILAAERAGTGETLKAELAAIQPQLLARFAKTIPDMYDKAYRWVDEMQSIAEFIGDFPEAAMLNGAAGLFARMAEDVAGPNEERGQIDLFFERE
jgi:L-threonate 2-dehydrogenase